MYMIFLQQVLFPFWPLFSLLFFFFFPPSSFLLLPSFLYPILSFSTFLFSYPLLFPPFSHFPPFFSPTSPSLFPPLFLSFFFFHCNSLCMHLRTNNNNFTIFCIPQHTLQPFTQILLFAQIPLLVYFMHISNILPTEHRHTHCC